MADRRRLVGAIEAGGTKFNCLIGSGPDDIRARTRIETTDPEETFERVLTFFRRAMEDLGPLCGLGIGSFGPLELNTSSPAYGYIIDSPKRSWSNTNFVGHFRDALGIRVSFDTDVNCAALAEWRWGAGVGKKVLIYVTIGTGIGGGILIEGAAIHGLIHPEIGHIGVRQPHDVGRFAGICPFHGDCLEGLASGPAIQARWGAPLDRLENSHLAYDVEADHLAELCATLTFSASPHVIILGGGVMNAEPLIAKIRERTRVKLGGYLKKTIFEGDLSQYIVRPYLRNDAGVLGALSLAMDGL